MQSGDSALLTGEIGNNLLQTMADELLYLFDPAFHDSAEWGKATADDATEFKSELTKFQASLDETIRGFGAGVTLAKVRKDVDLDATLRTATTGGVVPQDVIHAYEGKLLLHPHEQSWFFAGTHCDRDWTLLQPPWRNGARKCHAT
jgi:hypothetical protein